MKVLEVHEIAGKLHIHSDVFDLTKDSNRRAAAKVLRKVANDLSPYKGDEGTVEHKEKA